MPAIKPKKDARNTFRVHLNGGGCSSSDGNIAAMAGTPDPTQLTEARFIELLAKLHSDSRGQRPLIGIVCKPEFENILREECFKFAPASIKDVQGKSNVFFNGVEICTDSKQQENFLLFYDRNLLRQYLARYDGSKKSASPDHSETQSKPQPKG